MFDIIQRDKNTRARVGKIQLSNQRVVETPAYVIVGTYGEVQLLSPEDLRETKTQMVICNGYQLWRTMGEKLAGFQGLHAHMGWNGVIMTDSGGFQALSLGAGREHGGGKIAFPDAMKEKKKEKGMVQITDEGILFDDYEKKFKGFLSPEKSVEVQEALGSDIAFALDECTSPFHTEAYTKESLALTNRWELASLKAKKKKEQMLYGIVQGGTYRALREESARFVASQPFDGIGIGGSLGKGREEMAEILDWTIPLLPDEKPRHLLGIGKIRDIFESVERGIDTFDCIIPTRQARNDCAWTHAGSQPISGKWRDDSSPIDLLCDCKFCAGLEKLTRAELWYIGKRNFRHANEMKEGRARLKYILSFHNVYFFNTLMEKIRAHIKNGTFLEFKKEFLSQISLKD